MISAEKLEHEVIIRFQNSGEDIPNEALASLFNKFYRVDQSRSSDTGGTGLGLAIAKEIVTLHGGAISASSKNHVVTFTVSLPLSNYQFLCIFLGINQLLIKTIHALVQ